MKICLAQLNPIIGNFKHNLNLALDACKQAHSQSCELIVFPELFLSGYPARDLLHQADCILAFEESLTRLIQASLSFPNMGILIGTIETDDAGLYNSAILIQNGKKLFSQAKSLLPNYDIYDDKRHFLPAKKQQLVAFKGHQLGITVCEDVWGIPEIDNACSYNQEPITNLAQQGATLLINLSASPYEKGKPEKRRKMIQHHASAHGIPFIYANQYGGHDELLFDGRSTITDASGKICFEAHSFTKDLTCVDLNTLSPATLLPAHEIQDIRSALVMGIKDYVHKSAHQKVYIGLSGGIDSAVTAALAVEALGPENVTGIALPSPYSSQHSLDDAETLAKNLKTKYSTASISALYAHFKEEIQGHFHSKETSFALENLQSRIRGTILMTLANQHQALVLSTGNKSEMAMGYCTLYGDMNGALSVLADLYKTQVYELAKHINQDQEVIPVSSIQKPPSAELRPDQTDQDSLPPYPILDAVLQLYLEENKTVEQIISRGYEDKTVNWIIRQLHLNEHKRFQAAPGLRISKNAFGMGRRVMLSAPNFTHL